MMAAAPAAPAATRSTMKTSASTLWGPLGTASCSRHSRGPSAISQSSATRPAARAPASSRASALPSALIRVGDAVDVDGLGAGTGCGCGSGACGRGGGGGGAAAGRDGDGSGRTADVGTCVRARSAQTRDG